LVELFLRTRKQTGFLKKTNKPKGHCLWDELLLRKRKQMRRKIGYWKQKSMMNPSHCPKPTSIIVDESLVNAETGQDDTKKGDMTGWLDE
jgi:hypothetical protein